MSRVVLVLLLAGVPVAGRAALLGTNVQSCLLLAGSVTSCEDSFRAGLWGASLVDPPASATVTAGEVEFEREFPQGLFGVDRAAAAADFGDQSLTISWHLGERLPSETSPGVLDMEWYFRGFEVGPYGLCDVLLLEGGRLLLSDIQFGSDWLRITSVRFGAGLAPDTYQTDLELVFTPVPPTGLLLGSALLFATARRCRHFFNHIPGSGIQTSVRG